MSSVGARQWVFVFQNKHQNFGKWYREVLFNADIVDQRFPVKGCVVWKDYGTRIMERIVEILESLLNETGHCKMYFPLLIPEQLFGKEKRHLRGFEEQVFWVTKAGKRRLSHKLVIRPTSETAMYTMFSLWIRSHVDLPLKAYQTVSVFRYETKATKPLIRDREMWPFIEAHTVHATLEEAENQIEIAIEIYKKLFRKLSLAYLLLKKPRWELFPGAINAFEFYTLMPDKRVLETGSVNNLGQAFSRVFNISFEKTDGSHEYAFQTCYGQSERLLASVIAVHSDDHGLVLPPCIAPVLIVIVPIVFTEIARKVSAYAKSIEKCLRENGLSVVLDLRELTPGEKFYYWEKRGIPLRLEVGLRELDMRSVTVVRRDTLRRHKVSLQNLTEEIRRSIRKMEQNLWIRSKRLLKENIAIASTLAEAVKQISKGKAIIKTSWCGKEKCKSKIEEQNMEIIGISIEKETVEKNCFACGKEAKETIYLAKTY